MSSHFPRPGIRTLPAISWLAILSGVASTALVAMHYARSGQPMQRYLLLAVFVFATSMTWWRCFRVLGPVERARTEPDRGMAVLFDLMLLLPLVQLIGVLAAGALA